MTLRQLAEQNRSLTAQEYVLKTLRNALFDGTLPAGSRLVQADLAQQLNVSITPVREALRDLASEGLVVLVPNRGTVVRTLDIGEVREIYELRMTLEPLMVRRVMEQISADDLARARTLYGQMDATSDLAEWVELNRQFHSIFSQERDASKLAAILDQLRANSASVVRVSLHGHPERIASSNAEHGRLVDLYEVGDTDAAIALTVEHLQATIDAVEDSFTNQ